MAKMRCTAATGVALICFFAFCPATTAQPPAEEPVPPAPKGGTVPPSTDAERTRVPAPVTPVAPDVSTTPADSPPPFSISISNVQLQRVGSTLLLILVLAILLETGLATLFSWRLYLRYFEGRGWKTPIAVGVAYLFVNQFGIDAVAEILGGFSSAKYPIGFGGKFLTALIVAGGSNGVFRLLEQLGIRTPLQGAARAQDLRRHCSLKLEVTREQVAASKPIGVQLNGKLVGTIPANQNRFGGILGHKVEPGTLELKISGTGEDGTIKEEAEKIPAAPGASVFVPMKL